MKTIKHSGAFSLLEVLLVLLIMGVMATAILPSARETIEGAREAAEAKSLDELAATITASFEETDLQNRNVAALPGTIGTGETATEFSTGNEGYATTNAASWFAKVARLKGVTPVVGVAPNAQPALAALTFNSLGNPRLLFAGPAEAGQQRFLLLSLEGGAAQYAVPANDGTAAWFDAVWNHDWESRTADVPAYWRAVLSAPQVAAWSAGSAGLTQVHRLLVRRLVLPKYTVTVNNNHPANAAWVAAGDVPDVLAAPANSGANVSPEILAGRLVTVRQGAAPPGTEVLRFRLHENATVTLQ